MLNLDVAYDSTTLLGPTAGWPRILQSAMPMFSSQADGNLRCTPRKQSG